MVDGGRIRCSWPITITKPMVSSDFTLSAPKATLVCRRWSPDDSKDIKAKIVYVHGFSEHIGLYDEWFPTFASQGYDITMYDARGHGHTAKDSSEFGKSNEDYVMGDLEIVISHTLNGWDGKAVLWGFSMGGGVCLNYMAIGKQRERFDAYISCSPMVCNPPEIMTFVQRIKLRLLPVIVRVWPTFREDTGLNPSLISNDPEFQARIAKDPLCHGITTAALFHGAVTRGERLLDPEFQKLFVDKPLLLCQGTNDVVCDWKSSRKVFEELKLTVKKIILYDGLPHDLAHNLPQDAQKFRTDVLGWLEEQL